MSEDLTAYRHAPSGVGPLADEWKDKPHRLVYDLCERVEALEKFINDTSAISGGHILSKERHDELLQAEADVARLTREMNTARGERDVAWADQARAESALAEARALLKRCKAAFDPPMMSPQCTDVYQKLWQDLRAALGEGA